MSQTIIPDIYVFGPFMLTWFYSNIYSISIITENRHTVNKNAIILELLPDPQQLCTT